MVDFEVGGFMLKEFDPNDSLECRYMLEEIEELDNGSGSEYELYPVQPGEDNPRRGARGNPMALIQYESWPLYNHPKFEFGEVILNHMYGYRRFYKQIAEYFNNKHEPLPIYHREKFYVTSIYVQEIGKVMKGIDLNQPQTHKDVACLFERLKDLKREHERDQKRIHNEVVRPFIK
jgi:hypothetical protein